MERRQMRVVNIESLESWNSYLTQPTHQDSLIVVHFTASWCMPSVAMNPFFEELAFNYPDVLFLTVDVDEVKDVAAKLEIKAMPTFLLMKNGIQIDKLVGANPEETRKRIDAYVETIHAA
ncbi:thioredoxin-like protein CXXS1 [Momordica charantia]|uniref:Thioredoxin-like protein CXXS1 n=1 Tax=Momordica charantia TaxID=3673 RepID=A0A6J1CF17_MOMCH|nr:thioredoxin-like protein CXXS1 [Momordica charantia]